MSKTEHTPEPWPRGLSQAQVIGVPRMKTWQEYRDGCLTSFGGGHHFDGHYDAFQHGMRTVFRLLEAEFPPAEHCFACVNACAGINPEAVRDLLEACEAALALITQSSKIDWDDTVTPLLEAAIAKATGAEVSA